MDRSGDTKARGDYRHAYRLFAVIGVLVVAAVVARLIAVPPTFGELGFYRGAAVAEARDKVPRHVGETACAECHAKQVQLHDKDAHTRVECEVCHGPGLEHVTLHRARRKSAARSGKAPDSARMRLPKGRGACLTCHQELMARPGSFPGIAWQAHYKFVGVKGTKTPCTTCHDPHEPLYMDRDLRTARLHPLVHRCRDCHIGSARDPATPRPAHHPAIFECRYCHKEIVTDFNKRPHGKVRCSTCHIFFKQSAFAGRIIRDTDPRFCLLCHRAGEYRSDSAPPGIEWPDHREDVSEGPEDAQKRCIDCHRDRIHLVHKGKSDGS